MGVHSPLSPVSSNENDACSPGFFGGRNSTAAPAPQRAGPVSCIYGRSRAAANGGCYEWVVNLKQCPPPRCRTRARHASSVENEQLGAPAAVDPRNCAQNLAALAEP